MSDLFRFAEGLVRATWPHPREIPGLEEAQRRHDELPPEVERVVVDDEEDEYDPDDDPEWGKK